MSKIINVEYSTIQGSYWMIYGVICSFASVYLLAKGYTNSEIGVILAVANVLSVVVQPLVADFADRSKRFSLIGLSQMMTVLLMVLTVGMFIFQKKTLALSVIFIMIVAWLTTLQPLFNSLNFKLQEAGLKVSFGIARSMGSLFYSVLMAFLGTLVENNGIGVLPVTGEIVMAMLLASLALTKYHYGKAKGRLVAEDFDALEAENNGVEAESNALEAENTNGPVAEEDINLAEFIRRNKVFFVLNLGVLGVYFSNAILNNYTMQIVAAVGGTSEDMGRVFSLMAFLEIPTMLFFDVLRKKFSCRSMLKVAGIMFVVKIGVMHMAKSVAMILAAQFLQLFSFALFLPSMVHFINEIMSPGEAVKGQALYTTMITVSTVIASIVGGVLLDLYGAKMLTLVGTLVTAAGAAIVVGSVDKVKTRL